MVIGKLSFKSVVFPDQKRELILKLQPDVCWMK